MPIKFGIIRTSLDDATRNELRDQQLADLPPRVSEGIEMVALPDAGGQPRRSLPTSVASRRPSAIYSGPATPAVRRP